MVACLVFPRLLPATDFSSVQHRLFSHSFTIPEVNLGFYCLTYPAINFSTSCLRPLLRPVFELSIEGCISGQTRPLSSAAVLRAAVTGRNKLLEPNSMLFCLLPPAVAPAVDWTYKLFALLVLLAVVPAVVPDVASDVGLDVLTLRPSGRTS